MAGCSRSNSGTVYIQRYYTGLTRELVRLTEFEHVVHLNVVSFAWKGLCRSLGTIAIVIALLEICLVFYLLLSGKSKELLAYCKLAIYFFLRQPKPSDIEETNVMDGILQLCRQLLLATWSIELRQIQCDQISPVNCLRLDFCT